MNILLADLHKYVGYSGGIENVLAQFASAMHERGHAVTAVFADEKDGQPFFPMPAGVKIYNLYRVSGMKAMRPGTVQKILREIVRPFSRAAARERNYRMLAQAAPAMEEILTREKPDVIGRNLDAGKAGRDHFFPGADGTSSVGRHKDGNSRDLHAP